MKCSAKEMARLMEACESFRDAGIAFVPMPVLNREQEEAFRRISIGQLDLVLKGNHNTEAVIDEFAKGRDQAEKPFCRSQQNDSTEAK